MSFDTMDSQAKKQRETTEKNAAFEKWMSDPLVRMSLSMIPAGEHQDALQVLLRSAFDAGHAAGGGAMAGTFLEAILSKDMKRDRPA